MSASGAGTLDVGGESATFAFDVSRAGADGRVLGRLVYRNRGRALMVIGDAITSLDVSGSTATFSGTCTDPATGTPCRFTVRATAGDRFGRGATLTVEVAGAWTDSGTVRGGVIRVLSGPAVTLPVSGRGDGVSAAVAES